MTKENHQGLNDAQLVGGALAGLPVAFIVGGAAFAAGDFVISKIIGKNETATHVNAAVSCLIGLAAGFSVGMLYVDWASGTNVDPGDNSLLGNIDHSEL